MPQDPTERFSDRVQNYIRFRPGYPPPIVPMLISECGLSETSRVADIGSGTGILTEHFLRLGNRVAAVEPNREMREAAERLWKTEPTFRSVAGRAEATTLADRSVDFVTAAQSFHWFDREAARREFRRILTDDGWVVLLWNERNPSSSAIARAYEELLIRHGTDYLSVDHRRIDEKDLATFFGPGGFQSRSFANSQTLDESGLRGRVLSASYMPPPGHPRHEGLLQAVDALYRRYASHAGVLLEYETKVHFGHLT